jgi:hypothetical protein
VGEMRVDDAPFVREGGPLWGFDREPAEIAVFGIECLDWVLETDRPHPSAVNRRFRTIVNRRARHQ